MCIYFPNLNSNALIFQYLTLFLKIFSIIYLICRNYVKWNQSKTLANTRISIFKKGNINVFKSSWFTRIFRKRRFYYFGNYAIPILKIKLNTIFSWRERALFTNILLIFNNDFCHLSFDINIIRSQNFCNFFLKKRNQVRF